MMDLPPSWKKLTLSTVVQHISDDPEHPARIALRTYALALSLSLGPVALSLRPKGFRARAGLLWRALQSELRPTGFASAITAAVGGGAALQRLWDLLGRQYTRIHSINARLSSYQRAFLANVATSTLALALLRQKRYRRNGSSVLDLTLLFLVRACDAVVQAFLLQKGREIAAREPRVLPCEPDASSRHKRREDLAEDWRKKVTTHLDALVFWASSARIMWCFFYEPQRLPPSYGKWINSLARVDQKILDVLRAAREGKWSYIHDSSKRDIVLRFAEKLGHPSSWGDPALLPAYGGNVASEAWKQLGVRGRNGVGGLPCDIVHCGTGARIGLERSCVANGAIRFVYGFAQSLAIYLPVHFLPILLTKPSSILRLQRTLSALLSAIQSATFLSAFLSLNWFGVCFARTLVLARLFPNISHDVWDGPYGGILFGSLVAGASIWIENAKRRGEMALYVSPKALGASIPERWLRSKHPTVRLAKSLTFILSLASLLTFSVHQPGSLRGVMRWMLTFVMKGSSTGLCRKDITTCPTCPPTTEDSTRPDGPDYHKN